MFLPGAAEIRRTETLLRERIDDPAVDIVALFGALDAATQDRAIAPAPPGHRKIVLATSIAETSLTIEGVRIVIDSGLARVPRYEPDVGLTRLETVRVSRAAADQRRGRAGRTEPGVCYRLWDEAADRFARSRYTRPEILVRRPVRASCSIWRNGASTIRRQLPFLDPPPAGRRTPRREACWQRTRRRRCRRPHHRRGQGIARIAAAAAAGADGGRCRPTGRGRDSRPRSRSS